MPPVADAPLFFLDYDGTLSEICDDPMQAFPHPAVPELLSRLMARAPLWIITGRHLRDLGTLLPLTVQAVGLHGIQEGFSGGKYKATMPEKARQAILKMKNSVPQIEDIRIEDKEHAFAVHYRGAKKVADVKASLSQWLLNTPGELVVIHGKDVVELRPEGISKGHAVSRIAKAHKEHQPVYIGDDTTDEEAFKALGQNAITIKVGDGETAARYRLPDVSSVIAYLQNYV